MLETPWFAFVPSFTFLAQFGLLYSHKIFSHSLSLQELFSLSLSSLKYLSLSSQKSFSLSLSSLQLLHFPHRNHSYFRFPHFYFDSHSCCTVSHPMPIFTSVHTTISPFVNSSLALPVAKGSWTMFFCSQTVVLVQALRFVFWTLFLSCRETVW